ncbi:MAG TPA: bacterioferritin [bacterium]|jgi:bacterioferritin
MKGNDKIIEALNRLLADELTAINQYMVQSEMCDNWGYTKLHKQLEKHAIDEMHHAEWHIGRIIFLEGMPIVSNLNAIKIGRTVQEMIVNNNQSELDAIGSYNNVITLAHEVKDQGTVELLMKILKDEERHRDWGEAQLDQIEQMGIQNYLAKQSEGATA